MSQSVDDLPETLSKRESRRSIGGSDGGLRGTGGFTAGLEGGAGGGSGVVVESGAVESSSAADLIGSAPNTSFTRSPTIFFISSILRLCG